MNTFITTPILQIHTSQDVNHNTLSKAVAIYEKDTFELAVPVNTKTYKQIRILNHINASSIYGGYSELLPQFTWHLN